jgi:hypothetical protein
MFTDMPDHMSENSNVGIQLKINIKIVMVIIYFDTVVLDMGLKLKIVPDS